MTTNRRPKTLRAALKQGAWKATKVWLAFTLTYLIMLDLRQVDMVIMTGQ